MKGLCPTFLTFRPQKRDKQVKTLGYYNHLEPYGALFYIGLATLPPQLPRKLHSPHLN